MTKAQKIRRKAIDRMVGPSERIDTVTDDTADRLVSSLDALTRAVADPAHAVRNAKAEWKPAESEVW